MKKMVISRVFSAPRSLVFDCWVNPVHFAKWGLLPADCTPTLRHADVRPDGCYIIEQHGPGEAHVFAKFVFREINPIDRLVLVTCICTEDGEMVTNPYSPSWPRSLLATVVFEDEEPGTRITVEWEPLDATDDEIEFFAKNMHNGKAGWSQTFDRLSGVVQDRLKLDK
ncbi:MAG: SRPBCC domain-containing protein [Chthonomonadales bacterium]